MKKLVIFDAQGPVYVLKDEKGKLVPLPTTREFKKRFYPKFFDNVKDIDELPYQEEIRQEEIIVMNDTLDVGMNPGVIDFIQKLKKKGFTPVILTMNSKKALAKVLQKVIGEYNRKKYTKLTFEDIIPDKDRHSFLDLGLAKKNPEDWKKIINDNYPESEVVCVVEDQLRWLKQALQILNCKGYLVTNEKKGTVIKDAETNLEYYSGDMKRIAKRFFE